MLSLLGLLTLFIWTRVLETAENIDAATQCPTPAAPSKAPDQPVEPLGQTLHRTALDHDQPIPPPQVHVRVLNGNGESRQATLITEELANLGFSPGGDPGDDPVYPNYDLNCHGQIRFGAAGEPAARTLSLLSPCAQLVREPRDDDRIDLALGAEFDDIKTTPEAKHVLSQLTQHASAQQASNQGATTAAQKPVPSFTPEFLSQARSVSC